MITDLGKEIRKLRIDKGENLSAMSKKLGISISYLSAIENGMRETPPDFVAKLCDVYRLSKNKREAFADAEANSASKISIPLESSMCEQRRLAFALSRKLNKLSVDECQELMNYLEGDDGD